MDQITLKNKRIYDFYKNHSSISFETMNLLVIDLLEKLMQNSQPTLDQTLASSILEEMTRVKQQLARTETQMNQQLLSKMVEMKKDYMNDLQLVMNSNNTDKIAPIVQKYNESLQDKIKILIHELLPKTQEGISKEITSSLKELHSNIQRETNGLANTAITKKTLEEFVSSIDNKFAKSLVSSQTFLNTMISSTEQRITTKVGEGQQKVNDMESEIKLSQIQQKVLQDNINDLLRKFENSSSKGRISENVLEHVLHNLYPTAQIDSVATTKETGDIMLLRNGKPTILFENKNYDKNVIQEEVKKFLRDIEVQNCCGIMCAQHYGIANKDNFQIDVHNGNILVYLHAVEYNPDKLKIAVDIIDHFKSTMEDLECGEDVIQFEKDTLDTINKEYQLFISNKANQVKTVKEYTNKILSQIDEQKLPQLEHLLSKYFASSTSKENICDYCNYSAKNPRALMAHQRGCVEKKKIMNVEIKIPRLS
jgi:hypothetical protein